LGGVQEIEDRMNVAKAAFFDAQVGASWAAAEYGQDEAPKNSPALDRSGDPDRFARA
jgi:hypothetical protein